MTYVQAAAILAGVLILVFWVVDLRYYIQRRDERLFALLEDLATMLGEGIDVAVGKEKKP
jgi:hypothetical protein